MKIDDQGSPNFSDVNLKDKQYDVFDIYNILFTRNFAEKSFIRTQVIPSA